MHSELVKLEQAFNRSILTKIDDTRLKQRQIELWIKRDDLLHPVVSGNKWRKLKYILDHALALGSDTIVSMGGAHSNHLHALAYVGKMLGLKTIGLVRGDQPAALNPTLKDISDWGMQLRYVSRSEYRIYRQYKEWHDLPGIKANQYWLPEGGAQSLALRGVAELIHEIDLPFDTICVACGTGTTLAGIVDAVTDPVSVLGFSALKNANFLNDDVCAMLSRPCNSWRINLDYHFGGFAKTTNELISFIEDFELKTTIPLDPVYTGKMMFGIYDLVEKGYFKPGQRIIAVHTGGLQGKREFGQ